MNTKKTKFHKKELDKIFNKKIKSVKPKTYKGIIDVKKSGNGWLFSLDLDHDIFIPRKFVGNVTSGDEVEVELIQSPLQYAVEGKVATVVKRYTTQFVGEYIKFQGQNFIRMENGSKVKLLNYKKQEFRHLTTGMILVVEVTEWKRPFAGNIIEILGDKNSPHISLKRIARKYGFNEGFSDKALNELDNYSQEFILAQQDKRKYFKREDYQVFTVDPADAKDFDDAIHISKDETGNYILDVHIADVSTFIPEESELDNEARQQGFSLYLPSSVVPMLPQKLSNLLCSLNPEIPRLAFSCFMVINKVGEIIKYKFEETIIESSHRFDYAEFQDQIDKTLATGNPDKEYSDFKETLILTKELKDILKQKRVSEGSLEFNLPETKIALDENGKVTDIYPYKVHESNNIIEEFMLAANKCAAEFLFEREEKLPGVYRIHDTPDEEKLRQYFIDLEKNGIKIKQEDDITNYKFIQKVIKEVQDSEGGDFLVQNFLRSMKKAKYSVNNIGHYGLGFKLYTHFTSPIRRYADLMVHRIIKKHLGKLQITKKDKPKKFERKCQYTSIREIKSIRAEYEAKDLKVAEFMAEKVGNDYKGTVVSVTPYGAYVRLDKIPVEGMLHISQQKDDHYEFNEETRLLKGRKTGNELFVGKVVDITVLRVDQELLLIDFVLKASE